ncbi:phage protein NinX family protein [Pseudomonas segetis]|uniref:DUF2591 domain-containing protein n=1 Tax=Pseudomonas segetis TaxID=298908 RepID=A0A239CB80_9PSED|nr:phage protein NinX family protein [Pseudomonas segetis]SNS16948.1 Protein of unknown function [Pseudomonas segetis]
MTQMTEVNVAEATGAALDWLTGSTEGLNLVADRGEYGTGPRVFLILEHGIFRYRPSTEWSQGGPLLDKHCKSFGCVQDSTGSNWRSLAYGNSDACDSIKTMRLAGGPTILIAACRAIVTAKLGDKVMVPAELTGGDL